MQSLEARKHYRNSFHCAYRIFTEEGILRFWTGTTPRLTRLVVCPFIYIFATFQTFFVAVEWRYCLHRVWEYHQGDRGAGGIKVHHSAILDNCCIRILQNNNSNVAAVRLSRPSALTINDSFSGSILSWPQEPEELQILLLHYRFVVLWSCRAILGIWAWTLLLPL